ncbi:leucyl aminopeptidase, peptidase M17 family [Arcobacter acticola]|jgi:leucyl aminopeptidase|uniref:Leucyl aminopeptidase, peptidase M17 family n=1 Tax=Arcobacter acticola TaxID=1849015 RepID=A0A6M8ETJ4_9BACT|nr:leucyl aminopeptidase [Arcobacter acticola]QKE27787.1 leucyl aminopeptidase, peptidase M17 family [Arcobacter acticola]
MNITLNQQKINETQSSLEIVILNKIKYLPIELKELLNNINFFKKSFNTHYDIKNNKLYVSCLKLKDEELKTAFASAIRFFKNLNIQDIKIDIIQSKKELSIQTIVEGLVLGNYEFLKYKSSNKIDKNSLIEIFIENSFKSKKKLESELKKALIISNSVNYTKDIVNSSPEDYYPQIMAEDAMQIAKSKNITCKIFGEDYLKEKNMNAMYSVGIASPHESKLIHLTYKAKNPIAKIILVGKGVTYDTGGMSLKRGDGMVSMKCDKGGGASVMGVIHALSSLNLPFEVHGIVGAVENMIGGDAYKPGDILTASNNKTIEVTNTDAEGRLVLADCLHYAQENIKDFDYIFDLATLTGASIGAFGGYTTAVMGYSEKLKKKISKASKKSGELVGFLPFNDYLEKLLESQVADFVNTSPNKNGAAITASLFLSKFIKDKNKKKWLHFDIAGPSYRKEVWAYNSYGATGVAVRLLIKFMEDLK